MPHYQIITPEQVTFRYEVAGLATRGLAWCIDLMMLLAAIFVILMIGQVLMMLGMMAGGFVALGYIWALLGIFFVSYSYFVFFEMYWKGQTPGKRVFKLRVISASGARLAFADSMIRNLLRPVDLLLWVIPIGAVVAWIDPSGRRLGDLAAGTLVIRDVRHEPPRALNRHRKRDNSFAEDPGVRGRITARVTRDERDLIYDLVQRRDQLEPAVRDDLFAQAADHFRRRFGLPDDLEHLSDEQTVINLALVIQGPAKGNGR